MESSQSIFCGGCVAGPSCLRGAIPANTGTVLTMQAFKQNDNRPRSARAGSRVGVERAPRTVFHDKTSRPFQRGGKCVQMTRTNAAIQVALASLFGGF